MRRLYACSSNSGKLAEFSLAASECGLDGFEILPLPGLREIAAPEETGLSFEENAILKACYYSRFAPEFVFADDSGLAVDALGGAPGIQSARFAGPNATDADNINLLLRSLNGQAVRSAHFLTAVALARSGEVLRIGHGRCDGEILHEPQGNHGFGYDPVFFYPPLGRSFGELENSAKLAVSARGNALRDLFGWMSQSGL